MTPDRMSRRPASRGVSSRRDRRSKGDRSQAGALSRAAARLLDALVGVGRWASPDPIQDDRVVVMAAGEGISLACGTHRADALEELAGRDLVEPGEGRGRVVVSAAGRAHRRRRAAMADGAEAPFADQHRDVVEEALPGDPGAEPLRINTAESPLAWLRRRRDPDGAPLLDAAAFEAGERLRRDLTVAGLLPSVTARWGEATSRGPGGIRDPAAATDAVIAARQRVRQALDAVGGDFADLLVDLCGFLKGLEQIEHDRRWPARSGKVAVRLALRQLARHYGLETEARGPARARGILSWTDPGGIAA